MIILANSVDFSVWDSVATTCGNAITDAALDSVSIDVRNYIRRNVRNTTYDAITFAIWHEVEDLTEDIIKSYAS